VSLPNVANIAAGGNFACALTTARALYCWGNGEEGKLGNGVADGRNMPALASLDNATHVSAGGNHACAVSAGRAYCWGSNAFGQVAPGAGSSSATPFAVPGIVDATRVAAGGYHSCALRADGSITCWGANNDGQLGNGGTTSPGTPAAVTGIGAANEIVAGGYHTCAIASPGNGAFCWGGNDRGQVGAQSPTAQFASPQAVRKSDGAALVGVVSIAAGAYHSCASGGGTGDVYCWGFNRAGQLGAVDRVPRDHARSIGLSPALEVTAGEDHGCALLLNGERHCWGSNATGQLGFTSRALSTPTVSQAFPARVREVAAGLDHSCVRTDLSPQHVLCFGNNSRGQLGTDTFELYEGQAIEPLGSPGLTLAGLRAGSQVSCMYTESGRAYCWGDNNVGQLGIGETDPFRESVTAVAGPAGSVTDLGVAEYHACAIADARVHCWGHNGHGQLGVPDAGIEERSPREVPGIADAVRVAPGTYHTCVLHDGGAVSCWGGNEDAELGGGSTTPARSDTPLPVAGVTNVVALGSGRSYSCALLRDGTVRCWGVRSEGQLGNGSVAGSGAPSAVLNVQGANAIAVGLRHACALIADGGVARCWGRGEYGQLGDGVSGPGHFEATPRAVQGLGGASAIAAGGEHACAIVDGGALACWGSGFSGQLGDATPVSNATPVRVVGIP
jgi:alpha-tubulin suppressor-like RCC1 family protein